MILSATPVTPTTAQSWLSAILPALVALAGAWLVYRNARKANRITEQNTLADQQLAWTRQAMTEAHEAKAEARSATDAANEAERTAKAATAAADAATRRAEAAESRLAEVTSLAERLMDWIGRVVRKAHEIDEGSVVSPGAQELIRVINGGPPEISASRLRRKAE